MGLDFAKLVKNIIPAQEVIVGGKSSKSSGVPIDVKLKLDPEFSKTLVKVSGILALGIGLGIASGIVISKKRNG